MQWFIAKLKFAKIQEIKYTQIHILLALLAFADNYKGSTTLFIISFLLFSLFARKNLHEFLSLDTFSYETIHNNSHGVNTCIIFSIFNK
jgi:hypothetical protein